MAAEPDAWTEIAYVSLSKSGGSEVNFQALTETVDIDIGEKGGEGIPTLAGGRVWKNTPMEDSTVTLEMYCVFAGTTGTSGTGYGVFDIFNSGAGQDASQPIAVTLNSADVSRLKYRLCITWTDDSAFAGGTAATAASTNALRFVMADAQCISVKVSMTDGILKFTVAFKAPAYDINGAGTIQMASGDDTALTALSAYVFPTTKF